MDGEDSSVKRQRQKWTSPRNEGSLGTVTKTTAEMVSGLPVLLKAVSDSVHGILHSPCSLKGTLLAGDRQITRLFIVGEASGKSAGELTVVSGGSGSEGDFGFLLNKVPHLIAPGGKLAVLTREACNRVINVVWHSNPESVSVGECISSPDLHVRFQYSRNLADCGSDDAELKIVLSVSLGPLTEQGHYAWFAAQEDSVKDKFQQNLKDYATMVDCEWKFNHPRKKPTVSQVMMRDPPPLSDLDRLHVNVQEVMYSRKPPPPLKALGAILLKLAVHEGLTAANNALHSATKQGDGVKAMTRFRQLENMDAHIKPARQGVVNSIMWQLLGCHFTNEEIRALNINRKGGDLYELRFGNTPHVRMVIDFMVFQYFPGIYFGFETNESNIETCFETIKVALQSCYVNTQSPGGETRVKQYMANVQLEKEKLENEKSFNLQYASLDFHDSPVKWQSSMRRSQRTVTSILQKQKKQALIAAILTDKEDGLSVATFEGKGRGVIAKKSFQRGEFVVEYRGELVSKDEGKKRECEYGKNSSIGCYLFYFECGSISYCIDATYESHYYGRLVNHSAKRPNLVPKAVEIDGIPRVILIAAKKINSGDELLYDYGERNANVIAMLPWLKH